MRRSFLFVGLSAICLLTFACAAENPDDTLERRHGGHGGHSGTTSSSSSSTSSSSSSGGVSSSSTSSSSSGGVSSSSSSGGASSSSSTSSSSGGASSSSSTSSSSGGVGSSSSSSSSSGSASSSSGSPSGVYALPAGRVTLWKPGVTYNGGIPSRTTNCATLSPSGGDDTATIQAALNACPDGQVVFLNPGTFNISGTTSLEIHHSITLRGSGPAKTRILRTDTQAWPIVITGQRWFKYMTPVDLAADAVKGSSSITLASNPGYSVGEIVYIDQLPDANVYWGTHVGGATDPSRGWFCEENRPIGQTLEIASINGNTLTFTTSLHISFLTGNSAHVLRISNGAQIVPATKWAGIEDLTVANGGGGDGGGNIHMFASAYSWAKNIESYGSLGHSVNMDGCFRCELRDSYVHSTRNPNPGGDGYGVGVNGYASDNLFENNIIWNFNKMTMGRAGGGGNVWGYNYMDDGWGQGYPTIPEIGSGPNHYATAHFELFEGNQSFNFDTESYWGNSIYATVFRNQFTGLRGNRQDAPTVWPGSTYPVPMQLSDQVMRRVVGAQTATWNYNFVGNVLGFQGMPLVSGSDGKQTSFIYEAAQNNVDLNDPVPCWKIGYDGTTHPTQADPSVLASLLRDANYDYCSSSVHWHGIGGSGAGSTPSPVPTLPNSLYMPSKPAFFGSAQWPWVDPVGQFGSATTYTLPARARFDSGKPNG